MYLLSGIIQKFKDHLKALSNELGDFAVLGILLSPDDEVDEARSVPEDGGSVRLGDPHEAGRVHLEGDGENGVAGDRTQRGGEGKPNDGWNITLKCLWSVGFSANTKLANQLGWGNKLSNVET